MELIAMSPQRTIRFSVTYFRFRKSKTPICTYFPLEWASSISARVGAAKIWDVAFDAPRSRVLNMVSLGFFTCSHSEFLAYLRILMRICQAVYVLLDVSQDPLYKMRVPGRSTRSRNPAISTDRLATKTTTEVATPH